MSARNAPAIQVRRFGGRRPEQAFELLTATEAIRRHPEKAREAAYAARAAAGAAAGAAARAAARAAAGAAAWDAARAAARAAARDAARALRNPNLVRDAFHAGYLASYSALEGVLDLAAAEGMLAVGIELQRRASEIEELKAEIEWLGRVATEPREAGPR